MLAFALTQASASTTASQQRHIPVASEQLKTIYVLKHGWHTSITVQKDDVDPEVWPQISDFPDADYLEVGWGDKAFYQTPDPGAVVALKAAFLSKGSVLHVVGFNSAVQNYFPRSEVIQIALPESGFRQLTGYIAETYAQPESVGPGLYGNSRFYPAHGEFRLTNNCNTWVVRALQTAGCPIKPKAKTASDAARKARKCRRAIHEMTEN